jgi:hypothetical protein
MLRTFLPTWAMRSSPHITSHCVPFLAALCDRQEARLIVLRPRHEAALPVEVRDLVFDDGRLDGASLSEASTMPTTWFFAPRIMETRQRWTLLSRLYMLGIWSFPRPFANPRVAAEGPRNERRRGPQAAVILEIFDDERAAARARRGGRAPSPSPSSAQPQRCRIGFLWRRALVPSEDDPHPDHRGDQARG